MTPTRKTAKQVVVIIIDEQTNETIGAGMIL